jgi:predicted Zn-dependent peptidase
VVLSGAVDPATAREWISAHFAQIPAGDEVPAPREPGRANLLGEIAELKLRSPLVCFVLANAIGTA